MLPIISIIGRPNVGKSTLFNRLTGKRTAIIHDVPGTSRDRVETVINEGDVTFRLIDTGGVVGPGDEDNLSAKVRHQTITAIEEADLVLFVCDGKSGLTPIDEEIARLIRTHAKHPFVIINKVDTRDEDSPDRSAEFFRLGFGEAFTISAMHGRGIPNVLDAIRETLPASRVQVPEKKGIKLIILGKPNVGKSSFLNTLIGDDRLIVDDIPGTTRDAVSIAFEHKQHRYVLTDTAGIRKKAKDQVDFYATLRSKDSIERSDVGIVLFDAYEGISRDDLRILKLVVDAGKGCLLVANKWDLVRGTPQATYEKYVRAHIRFLDYVPVCFISAKTGYGLERLLDRARIIAQRRETHISTSRLNKIVQKAQAKVPTKLYYITQISSAPMSFMVFVNNARAVTTEMRRFVTRTLIKGLRLEGIPITIAFRKRTKGASS